MSVRNLTHLEPPVEREWASNRAFGATPLLLSRRDQVWRIENALTEAQILLEFPQEGTWIIPSLV
jgi:hypothetical protein